MPAPCTGPGGTVAFHSLVFPLGFRHQWLTAGLPITMEKGVVILEGVLTMSRCLSPDVLLLRSRNVGPKSYYMGAGSMHHPIHGNKRIP